MRSAGPRQDGDILHTQPDGFDAELSPSPLRPRKPPRRAMSQMTVCNSGTVPDTGCLFKMKAACHSSVSNTRSAGSSGSARPSRMNRLMRQAMTTFSSTSRDCSMPSMRCEPTGFTPRHVYPMQTGLSGMTTRGVATTVDTWPRQPICPIRMRLPSRSAWPTGVASFGT